MKMGFCDLYSRGTIKSQKINANVRGPSGAGLPVWVWYYTMFLTIGVALENLGVSYFEFWPKSKWKCSIVMNFLYFPPKLFVLCLFHECVNTRKKWRALFVRFWFIYLRKCRSLLSFFFVSFCSTHFFFRNQTVWKQWCIISVSLKITCNLGCEMCTISEYMYTIIHVHKREKCIQCGPSMTF